MKFIDTNNLIHENQIGFKEKSQTRDHIFTMKTINETHQSKNKVFAAFINLRMAFDIIWREGLFYKLCINDFPHYIIRIILSMYEEHNCILKRV